jgi:septation ring formation regulator EzrA
VEHLTKENQSLQAKMVYSERQLQVEQATQSNLSKELTKLQDEDMKLKEDLAFYKNMLGERARRGR